MLECLHSRNHMGNVGLCQFINQMIILMRPFTIIAFVLPMASHAKAAETFPAHVVGVVDGDTLRVIRRKSGNWILN